MKKGIILLVLFGLWTWLIQVADVQPAGQSGTEVGFATLNCWFHELTGVHMTIYNITDWLGLLPVFVCMIFACLGLIQLIKRRGLFKVDLDIIFLGIYYIIVIACYLIFEMYPINYRPIFIQGFQETSYPSSTTLLVLCVMPTLVYQANRRIKHKKIQRVIKILTIVFSGGMVIGRTVAGVHWLTDIIGAMLLSTGLFCLYKAAVLLCCKEENRPEGL